MVVREPELLEPHEAAEVLDGGYVVAVKVELLELHARVEPRDALQLALDNPELRQLGRGAQPLERLHGLLADGHLGERSEKMQEAHVGQVEEEHLHFCDGLGGVEELVLGDAVGDAHASSTSASARRAPVPPPCASRVRGGARAPPRPRRLVRRRVRRRRRGAAWPPAGAIAARRPPQKTRGGRGRGSGAAAPRCGSSPPPRPSLAGTCARARVRSFRKRRLTAAAPLGIGVPKSAREWDSISKMQSNKHSLRMRIPQWNPIWRPGTSAGVGRIQKAPSESSRSIERARSDVDTRLRFRSLGFMKHVK